MSTYSRNSKYSQQSAYTTKTTATGFTKITQKTGRSTYSRKRDLTPQEKQEVSDFI